MPHDIDAGRREPEDPAAYRREHEQALRDIRRSLAERIVDYARRGDTARAPGVLQEDVAFYLDPELYAREHRKLFLATPLVACLSNEIPEPGDYKIFDDTGVPIVVTRGKDGRVRALLNACPHRGARVVREATGQTSRFTCRFHGWTFDSTGHAIGIPQEAEFCGQIEDQKHLLPCPAEERHGLVFVQATPNSTMDLDAHLGDFGPVLEAFGLQQATPVIGETVASPSNWKYALDTYFENYHLPSLHRDTFAHVFAHNLTVFEAFGPHMRFTYPQQSFVDWKDKPPAEWPIDSLPIQHFLYPNTVLVLGSVSPSGSLISIHRLFPKSVSDVETKITLFAPYGVQSPAHRAEIEASFAAIMGAVVNEDYSVTGESYPSLAAMPAGTKLPFGRLEAGVQHIHGKFREAVA